MNTSIEQNITTGLYTDKAVFVLYWLKHCMTRDVKLKRVYHRWNRQYETIEVDSRMSRTGILFQLVRGNDNEVMFNVPTRIKKPDTNYTYINSSETYVRNRHDMADMRSWLAHNLKQYVIKHFGWDKARTKECWKRNCTGKFISVTIPPFGADKVDPIMDHTRDRADKITISDIYCVYEILKDRKNLNKRFGNDRYKAVVGYPANPLIAEMNKARADAIAAAAAEYNEAVKANKKWKEDELSRLYNELSTKLEGEASQKNMCARRIYEAKIAEANSVFEILDKAKARQAKTNDADVADSAAKVASLVDMF